MTPSNNPKTFQKKLKDIIHSLAEDIADQFGGDIDEHPQIDLERVCEQAITSLTKELVAEAKPEITFSKPEGMPNTLAIDFAQRHLNQFEQNLLKALEEV